MSKYKLLSDPLHLIADSAEFLLKNRFSLKKCEIETQIDPSIPWIPTLHWKTPSGFIVACEVSEKPFPPILKGLFGEISARNLPIKVFVAYPIDHSLTAKEYIRELNEAKGYGFGLLSADINNTGNFEHLGVAVPLFISEPKFKEFHIKIQDGIKNAYNLYINADPRHGVQELRQVIENVIHNLALQARKNNKLNTGKFPLPNDKFYALATLVEDLMTDKIIDNATLGKCRGFVEDGNATSHKPKTPKEERVINEKLKNAFLGGLLILKDLPKKMKDKGYKF